MASALIRRRRKRKELPFNPLSEEVPPVVALPANWIERNALKVEGIFRVSGSVNEIITLKKELEKNKYAKFEKCTQPHAIAGILKAFFRELPDPILTNEFRDCFLVGTAINQREARIKSIKQVLELLPVGNQVIIKLLMRLLFLVHQHRHKNQMGAKNLAIVFSPTVVRCPANTMEEHITNGPREKKLLTILIKYYEQIFEGKEIPADKRDMTEHEEDKVKVTTLKQKIKTATVKMKNSILKAQTDLDDSEEIPADDELDEIWSSGSTSTKTNRVSIMQSSAFFQPPPETDEDEDTEGGQNGKEEGDDKTDKDTGTTNGIDSYKRTKEGPRRPRRSPPPPPISAKSHRRSATETNLNPSRFTMDFTNKKTANKEIFTPPSEKRKGKKKDRKVKRSQSVSGETSPLSQMKNGRKRNRASPPAPLPQVPEEKKADLIDNLTQKYLTQITTGVLRISELRPVLKEQEGLNMDQILQVYGNLCAKLSEM